MADNKNNLLLLFQKPSEPIFTPKDGGTTVIDVPEEYYTDRYRPIGSDLSSRFGEDVKNKVSVKPLSALPDLSFASSLGRDNGFSLFNEAHKDMANKLMQIFINQPDAASLFSVAAYVRDRVNIYLFQYALSVAAQHRKDTKDIVLPSIVNQFPDQFVDPSAFPEAREEAAMVSEENRKAINIPLEYTASEKELEQRMAYFREDIGVNMHHWHWHLVYPMKAPLEILNKDRRGELFYYMHNQIIYRYNVDRICAGLERVKVLSNIRAAVPEAYFPKIIRSKLNRSFPPRMANATLQDVNRSEAVIELADLERWRDRIYQAIDQGYVVDTAGKKISLSGPKGIDILGNVVEASDLSPNKQLYGDLHSSGHLIICFCHDPEQKYLEEFGVMGDVATVCRDPIFYRWHGYIDDILQRHKKLMPSYVASTEIAYNGITVNSVNVQISKGKNVKPNQLLTFWQKSEVDLSTGLDFGPEGNVYASFTHLQHAPFEYTINVDNKSRAKKIGTCRIFMCPKNNERGQPFLKFEDQRSLMIEMDKFTVYMNPGQNVIRRRSDESSVTIPYERSFRKIGTQFSITDPLEKAQFQFCGCGWPQHMLLPKGSIAGTKFNIFVMISNFDLDRVDQPDLKSKVCKIMNSNYVANVTCKAKRVNRTMTLDTFDVSFHPHIILENFYQKLTIYKKFGTIYRQFLLKTDDDLCDFSRGNRINSVYDFFVKELGKYGNILDPCPVVHRRYFKEWPIDFSKLPEILPSGEFRLDILAHTYDKNQTNIPLTTVNIFGEVRYKTALQWK